MERFNEQGPGRLSTTEAVGIAISRNFVLQQALRMKVVNYHALAGQIAPRVEELTGRKSKLATLVVATKRVADRMVEKRDANLGRVLEGATVTLTGGMVEVTVMAKGTSAAPILEEVAKTTRNFAEPPDVMLLPRMVMVLAELQDGWQLKKELGNRYPIDVEDRLAKVAVRLGKRAQTLPGVATFITEILYRNGIVLRSAYIGRPETSLVMEERLGARAYEILIQQTLAK